jgi:C_GCAxxG_C_C family probable redox protein
MNKKEQAIKAFDTDSNCAQSVLSSFSEELKISKDDLWKVANGFGAGMGRLQNTCGAVTGGIMVLGLNSNKSQAKENIYNQVQEFERKFKAIHKTTSCKELLNCDLKTETGQTYFQKNNLHDNVCVNCVKTAINLIENDLKIFDKKNNI